MKYFNSMENPFWIYAEYEPGKRVTKDMVTFDTDRKDVQVNDYGVVLFYGTDLAKYLLQKDFGV